MDRDEDEVKVVKKTRDSPLLRSIEAKEYGGIPGKLEASRDIGAPALNLPDRRTAGLPRRVATSAVVIRPASVAAVSHFA